jgi:quercetin dioxygenase-like cupin family protein
MSSDDPTVPTPPGSSSAPDAEEGSPRLYPAADLQPEHPGQRGRWVIAPSANRWNGVVVGEWELAGAGWEDMHPNPETSYVVDGELYVESAGTTVVARRGDVVQVPGGHVGKYWAPRYARMVAFHGPTSPQRLSRSG